MELPTTSGCASNSVWRMRSPPGTSPTPVWPLLSVRRTTLRVKNGACAPLRFSSMLSCPATGTTRISRMIGASDRLMKTLAFSCGCAHLEALDIADDPDVANDRAQRVCRDEQ